MDALLAVVVVLGASGFLVRWLRKPDAPACGATPASQPKVILGSRLARGLSQVQGQARKN